MPAVATADIAAYEVSHKSAERCSNSEAVFAADIATVEPTVFTTIESTFVGSFLSSKLTTEQSADGAAIEAAFVISYRPAIDAT